MAIAPELELFGGRGNPRLVISGRALKIGRLALKVKTENSASTWIYNKLIEWSKDTVRTKIETKLLESLDAKTDELLTTINELAEEYWPLLLSLSDGTADPAAPAVPASAAAP